MHNPPPQKPAWVWALIGSGGTLLLFLAGYGIWSLTTSKSPNSSFANITDVSKKSEDINALFPIMQNNKLGFIDRNGKIVIQPQFNNIFYSKSLRYEVQKRFAFPEGLRAVVTTGGWGFIDSTGKFVIEPKFNSIGNFSDGLAGVFINVNNGGKYIKGFIDKTGKLVITLPDDTSNYDEFYFNEGFAVIKKGKDGLGYRYMDRSGKFVFGTEFENADNFFEGLAKVTIKGRVGYIDYDGKIAIPPKYIKSIRFLEGLAPVEVSNGKWGYIDKNDQLTIPPNFELAGLFSEGLAPVKVNGKWGYIDKSGNTVINPQFDEVELVGFSEGLAPFKINGKSGYIDKNGNTVIQPQFIGATHFSSGLAPVSRKDDNGVTKVGYIDKTGKFMWESTY